MLDQNDLKQISTVVKENNKELTTEIVVQVGAFITENVLPAIDGVEERLSRKMNTLATKDDVSRAAADVKGTIVAKLRMEDDKVNMLIKFLKERNILTEEQWKALRALQVFPSIEV